MNELRSRLSIFAIAIFIAIGMEYLFLQNPIFIKNINSKLIDSAFLYRGEVEADKRIVIVDIDERSLKSLGQWPWSRDKIAKILKNLTDANVAIIGLDMVFAEKDRSSPSNIAKSLKIDPKNLPNFDNILANTLANTPTITGFTFNFTQELKNNPPPIRSIYIEHNKGEEEHLFKAKGITPNIPILQQSAYSSASFNTLPDSDGIVRYVPLLFSYDDSIYPSLSLEIVRTLLSESRVDIFYDENGVSGLKIGDLEIPTDESGRLFINYAGGAKKYRYISAMDIYNNTFYKDLIEGSIVLLGTSASGLLDLRATPFDSVYPGVEVHANAIDNLINANIIQSPSYIKGITSISIIISVVLSALIISFATPLLSFGLIVGFLSLEIGYLYDMLFSQKIAVNFAYPLLSTLFSVFVLTFIKIYAENRQKELISQKFAKKVSPQVAQKLLRSSKDSFETNEVEVTIFFSDIRDFTTISERFNDPKLLIEYLNEYMSPMSQIIIEHEGTIDKYIGDAIMAYWNAPLKIDNHADKALSAAIRQIEALDSLNQKLKERNLPKIEIGIGIHTGEAIVGEMGSKGRSDYTVIGDSINLGSRIEGLCKTYGAKILISKSTKDKLTKAYKLREIDRVQVKGKDEAVTIFEVLGFGEFNKEERELERIYQNAKNLYKKKRFDEAYREFYSAFKMQNSKLFALYMDRCLEYQKDKNKNISEIYRFETK